MLTTILKLNLELDFNVGLRSYWIRIARSIKKTMKINVILDIRYIYIHSRTVSYVMVKERSCIGMTTALLAFVMSADLEDT